MNCATAKGVHRSCLSQPEISSTKRSQAAVGSDQIVFDSSLTSSLLFSAHMVSDDRTMRA